MWITQPGCSNKTSEMSQLVKTQIICTFVAREHLSNQNQPAKEVIAASQMTVLREVTGILNLVPSPVSVGILFYLYIHTWR